MLRRCDADAARHPVPNAPGHRRFPVKTLLRREAAVGRAAMGAAAAPGKNPTKQQQPWEFLCLPYLLDRCCSMRQSALQHFLLVVQPVEPLHCPIAVAPSAPTPGGAGCRGCHWRTWPPPSRCCRVPQQKQSSRAVSWRPQGLAWPNPDLPVALLPCEYGVESQSDAAGPPGSASRGSSYSNLPEAQLALRYLD